MDKLMQRTIQKDINDLIKSVSETKGMLLAYPLLVEFFEGDHNAALFMNQILYWTDRTSNPDGWFYKTYTDWEKELQFSYYQINRVIFGDERVQNPKRNLSDVGLETRVKMAPNGRNATFYRLDVAQFIAMFVDWIEGKFGALGNHIQKLLRSSEESEPQSTPQVQSDTISTFEGNDWQSMGLQPQEPEVVPTERVQTLWQSSYRPDQEHTIADVWEMAHSQLELQFDRASFDTYLKHITLVDYDVQSLTFTLAVKYTYNFDVVRYRLHRNIHRVLSDVFGKDVEIVYITYDDWRDRHQ